MQEHQVDIVKTELLHGMAYRAKCLVVCVAAIANLCRDKKALTWNATSTDGITHPLLIVVISGRVYAPIACGNGFLHHFLRLPFRDVIDSETHHRH